MAKTASVDETKQIELAYARAKAADSERKLLKERSRIKPFNPQALSEAIANPDDHFFGLLVNPDVIFQTQGMTYKVFTALLNQPHLAGIVHRRKAGTLAHEWRLKTEEDGDKDVENAVYKMLGSYKAHKLIESILDTPLYGFSPIEIYWEYYDGMWWPERLISKPRDWFNFDKDLNLLYTYEGKETPCPPEKFLVPTYKATSVNPYGEALLSKLFWSVDFIKNSKIMWNLYQETFGIPWVVNMYDVSLGKDMAGAIHDEVIGMKDDGVITVPDKFKTTITSGADKGGVDVFLAMIDDCRKENSILILGHSSASESTPGKLGGESNAESATDDIIESDKRLVAEQMNELISLFCRVNWGDTVTPPEFFFYEEEKISKERAERDSILYNQGVRFSADYYKKHYNLDDADFIIEKSVASSPKETKTPAEKDEQDATSDNDEEADPKALILASIEPEVLAKHETAQALIDELIAHMISEYEDSLLAPAINTVRGEIAKASSLKQKLGVIDKLYPKTRSEEWEESLLRSSWICTILGMHAAALDEGAQSNASMDVMAKDEYPEFKKIVAALKLPPEKALEYMRRLGVSVSDNWENTLKLLRENIFSVTGISRMDILEDYRQLIIEALDEGLNLQQFRERFEERWATKNWESEEDEEGNRLPPHRVKLIYQMNLQTSYTRGRWEQMDSTAELFPYVEEMSITDGNTSDECNFLHGKIFRKDDSYYRKYLRAPGHFNCRRIALSRFEEQVEGKTIQDGRSLKKYKNAKGFEHEDDWIVRPDKKKYSEKILKIYENELEESSS